MKSKEGWSLSDKVKDIFILGRATEPLGSFSFI
jgi:hypothetical protein